jgi:hypothetical protein
MLTTKKNQASLACQVRMNIRCGEEMSYQTLAQILRNKLPYSKDLHQRYVLGFFEECYPSLMKKFMKEQSLSRASIINLFNLLPNQGEKYKFERALKNGEF